MQNAAAVDVQPCAYVHRLVNDYSVAMLRCRHSLPSGSLRVRSEQLDKLRRVFVIWRDDGWHFDCEMLLLNVPEERHAVEGFRALRARFPWGSDVLREHAHDTNPWKTSALYSVEGKRRFIKSGNPAVAFTLKTSALMLMMVM